jgi:hypothetical protein
MLLIFTTFFKVVDIFHLRFSLNILNENEISFVKLLKNSKIFLDTLSDYYSLKWSPNPPHPPIHQFYVTKFSKLIENFCVVSFQNHCFRI